MLILLMFNAKRDYKSLARQTPKTTHIFTNVPKHDKYQTTNKRHDALCKARKDDL